MRSQQKDHGVLRGGLLQNGFKRSPNRGNRCLLVGQDEDVGRRQAAAPWTAKKLLNCNGIFVGVAQRADLSILELRNSDQ
jgi:hypothetical protein